ncbi:hypothetical protein ACMXYX_10400 [Neptuniibacter sp. QD72_48]|uniref:hypothetical protein n=1 Tax=unclassified Neptuniibacter TaxID=2630693 RepID=UPI0039F4A927
MVNHLFNFFLMLLAPEWMRDQTPDKDHFYRRLFTAKHRAKRNKIKLLWICVLSLCVLFPFPHAIAALVLLTTFITFSWLDESN